MSILQSLFGRAASSVETLPARVRPHPDVFSAEHDEVTVLLDLRREVYLGIDEVGTTIWRGIERGATRLEILRELEQQYAAPPDLLAADAHAFMKELLNRRLVVRA